MPMFKFASQDTQTHHRGLDPFIKSKESWSLDSQMDPKWLI